MTYQGNYGKRKRRSWKCEGEASAVMKTKRGEKSKREDGV